MYDHLHIRDTPGYTDRGELLDKAHELADYHDALPDDANFQRELIPEVLGKYDDRSHAFKGYNDTRDILSITDQTTMTSMEAIADLHSRLSIDGGYRVIVASAAVIGETDTPELTHLETVLTRDDARIHTLTPRMLFASPVTPELKGAVRGAADPYGTREISDGPVTRHHGGRPPLGFEAYQGRLRPAEDYEDVCTQLQRVEEGSMSKRRAAERLDCSARTITNILEDAERRQMYHLDSAAAAGEAPTQ